MLPAEHRMRRRDDFTATVRQGRHAAAPLVVVHWAPPAGLAGSPDTVLVGFVVTRAVGGAVARNAVRRRLRQLMRERLGGLPPGSRVVVRARPAAVGATWAELARDVDGALERVFRAERVASSVRDVSALGGGR